MKWRLCSSYTFSRINKIKDHIVTQWKFKVGIVQVEVKPTQASSCKIKHQSFALYHTSSACNAPNLCTVRSKMYGVVGSSKNPIENELPLHFASHVQVGKFWTAPQAGTQHEKQKALVVPVTQFEIKTPHSIQIWYVFHLFVSRSGPWKWCQITDVPIQTKVANL